MPNRKHKSFYISKSNLIVSIFISILCVLVSLFLVFIFGNIEDEHIKKKDIKPEKMLLDDSMASEYKAMNSKEGKDASNIFDKKPSKLQNFLEIFKN